MVPFHVVHLFFFNYCGDTQMNRLEGKSLFKKFIDVLLSEVLPF